MTHDTAMKVLAGAVSGLLAAAAVDFHAFKTWQSFSDVKSYQWQVAAFRWVQGAVMGAMAALGLAGF